MPARRKRKRDDDNQDKDIPVRPECRNCMHWAPLEGSMGRCLQAEATTPERLVAPAIVDPVEPGVIQVLELDCGKAYLTLFTYDTFGCVSFEPKR